MTNAPRITQVGFSTRVEICTSLQHMCQSLRKENEPNMMFEEAEGR